MSTKNTFKVRFRRVVITEVEIVASSKKEVGDLIREHGAHVMATDSPGLEIVLDTTRVVGVEEKKA